MHNTALNSDRPKDAFLGSLRATLFGGWLAPREHHRKPIYFAHTYSNGIHFLKRWTSLSFPFSGLRLLAWRRFIVFLASIPCAASASNYCFGSAAQPRWRSAFSQLAPVAKFRLSVLASGSKISVKPTRILRSAYLAR